MAHTHMQEVLALSFIRAPHQPHCFFFPFSNSTRRPRTRLLTSRMAPYRPPRSASGILPGEGGLPCHCGENKIRHGLTSSGNGGGGGRGRAPGPATRHAGRGGRARMPKMTGRVLGQGGHVWPLRGSDWCDGDTKEGGASGVSCATAVGVSERR